MRTFCIISLNCLKNFIDCLYPLCIIHLFLYVGPTSSPIHSQQVSIYGFDQVRKNQHSYHNQQHYILQQKKYIFLVSSAHINFLITMDYIFFQIDNVPLLQHFSPEIVFNLAILLALVFFSQHMFGFVHEKNSQSLVF